MKKYTRSSVVEAEQWTVMNTKHLLDKLNKNGVRAWYVFKSDCIHVITDYGTSIIYIGDWVVWGENGKLYTETENIFNDNYKELVNA